MVVNLPKLELWIVVVDNNAMAEISARSLGSWLCVLSVHFHPQSLLSLKLSSSLLKLTVLLSVALTHDTIASRYLHSSSGYVQGTPI